MQNEHDENPCLDSQLERALDPYRDALRDRFPLDAVVLGAERRRQFRNFSTNALLCVTLACIWMIDPAYRVDTMSTVAGERRNWQLPDGSLVALDSATSAHLEWRLRSRRLVLKNGEARVKVAPSCRPFVTYAGNTVIFDVGTEFSVRHDTGLVRVGVVAGMVKVVSDGDAEITLHPDQAVDVRADRIGRIQPFNSRKPTGWPDVRISLASRRHIAR